MSIDEFTQLKHEIASAFPDFEARATRAWAEIIEELKHVTARIAEQGSRVIPIIDYSSLDTVDAGTLAKMKRCGTFVVREVVPRDEAQQFKGGLDAFVRANPNVEGTPASNPQYFQIFYAKPQVLARAHPRVLAMQTWCNRLYSHSSANEPVDLDTPLTYVDRFRIRQPGFAWGAHPPHADAGAIERWSDSNYRSCYANILAGDWRKHDPYTLRGRVSAKTSGKALPNQASIFRTFQGWLAVSETGPGEGTLQVFPDILLSSSYIMLRPFFTPTLDPSDPAYLDANTWRFDLSSPIFHGVSTAASAGAVGGVRPFEFAPATHPHLVLETSMVSVPQVHPGDMVFWQADVVHAVEKEHNGKGDSSVMYIPAVPACPQNSEYVQRQAELFAKGCPPPDFPQGRTELAYELHATEKDVVGEVARRAMGLTA